MRQFTYILVFCVGTVASEASVKTWHVPDECPTIQAGIDSSAAGDTVLVASGTYTGEGNRDIDFKGKAIVVTSENGPETTVIDCKGSYVDPHRGFYFHSEEDSNSVVQGFTIKNGYAPAVDGNSIIRSNGDYGGGIYSSCFFSQAKEDSTITGNETIREIGIFCFPFSPDDKGGGIFCDGSSPTIEGNIIIECSAYYGGGIYCRYSSSPTIEGNIITGNEAIRGGGIYCFQSSPVIVCNTITENEAGNYDYDDGGAGIYCNYYSSPTIEGNTIAENRATLIAEGWGGGIYCRYYSSPAIEGNTISGNLANNAGGIFCFRYSCPIIEGNIITGNNAGLGGGIYCNYYSSPTIGFDTISGNSAWDGGGIYCQSCTLTIESSTITGNIATNDGGGGIYCYNNSSSVVLNSILWADRADTGQEIYVDETSSIEVTYSNIQGGWEGEGNIDADPIFVLPEHRDFRLLGGSPCIDSGHPDSLDPDGTRSDMGAFYFDQSKPLVHYVSPDTTEGTPGTRVSVLYTVINCHTEPQEVGWLAKLFLSDGSPWPWNPLEGPKAGTVSASSILQHTVTYIVPASWPLGMTSLYSMVGLSPRDIFDADTIYFKIVEE